MQNSAEICLCASVPSQGGSASLLTQLWKGISPANNCGGMELLDQCGEGSCR